MLESCKKEKKLFLIAFLLILIDILTKTIFTGKTYLFSELIYINYSQNVGSSFGIFASFPYYNLIIILLSFIILLSLYIFRKEFISNLTLKLSLVLFISGVIGNLIDRLFFGFVRDFIALKNLFIFNFADFYLTLAVILIIYSEIKNK